ncbi:unnamed protein product [Heterobilharzia americana]|nr:unnamed protein product [Heterobilharzia americana]
MIIGAKITNFLLEKSRIVGQPEKERNYHVFYELLSSLDNESKAKHHLKSVEDYQYLMKQKSIVYPDEFCYISMILSIFVN